MSLPETDREELKSPGRRKVVIGGLAMGAAVVFAMHEKLLCALERNQGTVLDLPLGEYSLQSSPSSPPTYFLVHNHNSHRLYCLGFVQSTFDLIFGAGAAKRAGLYSVEYADQLDFTHRPVTVEKFNPAKHRNLKKGTIVRFVGMTHIGVVLDGNRIAHLIGDKLHIDRIDNPTSGWALSEVVMPNNSFKSKPIDPIVYDRVEFPKGKTVQEIGKDFWVEPELSSLWYLVEVLYELNRNAFEIKEDGTAGMFARLKKETKLRVPREWVALLAQARARRHHR